MLIDKIERAVYDNLQGGQVVALVQNPSDDIERDGYWEHSFIVVWSRPVRNGQPSLDNNGYIYATHRVHVNSHGDTACFNGNYDQSYLGALNDMIDRAKINLMPDVDRAVEAAMGIEDVHHVHLRRSGAGSIVGIVGDDRTAQEYNVRQVNIDNWYASDDDGTKHTGKTVVEAVLAARAANINQEDN
jgi:hypothetical protein